MTGENIVEDICGALSYDPDNATQAARVVRWANHGQLDMAAKDWPELITRNASFTTDGSENYDLTGESYLGSTFLRVVDRTVKISDVALDSRPKDFFDQVDPSRDYGSEALAYGMCGRKDFRLWPAEASGSTVYLDWVKYPTDIAADTAEASISFDKDWHHLIVLGGLKYGLMYVGDLNGYTELDNRFKVELTNAFKGASRATFKTSHAAPIDF